MRKIKVDYNFVDEAFKLCDYLEKMSNEYNVLDYQILVEEKKAFKYRIIIRYTERGEE